jgi:hypothetical protein
MQFLLLLTFIVLSFGSCKICLEAETYMWGLDDNKNIVPGTITTCWGILDCNQALCNINGLGTVTQVVLNFKNSTIFSREYTKYISGTCTEGQVFVFGVDSNYESIPNAVNTCWGLLSCNEAICSISNIPNVSYVIVMPTHG